MRRVRPWFVSTGILFLLWSFLFCFPVRAQEVAMADQSEVIQAPDVVVSATKTPFRPNKSPAPWK